VGYKVTGILIVLSFQIKSSIMEKLEQQIESLIFSSESPLSTPDIQDCLSKRFGLFIADPDLDAALAVLTARYQDEQFAFELKQIAGGYQFLTKTQYHETISVLLKEKTVKRLTTAAMETLAIIAYKQPISKSEIEQIRGVSVDYSIQKLLEKELIVIAGRSESVGKPVLYATSQQFMDYFGINSVQDLPKLKDILPSDEASTAGVPVESLN
jgi:segregation and condensation protein B